MAFRFPYVSLDIETTGLNTKRAHVLQIAAIYDNGNSLDDLPTFERVVKWPEFYYMNEFALKTNYWLLERGFRNDNVVSIETARQDFSKWLGEVQPEGKLIAAGKNIQGYDFPVLRNFENGFDLSRFIHRCLDPGSMYTEEFDHIPSLSEINKLLGRPTVSHNALDDCWDVLYAVRYKWLD